MPHELTAYVEWVSDGSAAFEGTFSSVYDVPPELEPVFREALAADREIMFTHSRKCHVLTARLAPPLPLMARLRRKIERLRLDYWKRKRQRWLAKRLRATKS